jgi:hypothetical protein
LAATFLPTSPHTTSKPDFVQQPTPQNLSYNYPVTPIPPFIHITSNEIISFPLEITPGKSRLVMSIRLPLLM